MSQNTQVPSAAAAGTIQLGDCTVTQFVRYQTDWEC
jgi:hypothetical protein